MELTSNKARHWLVAAWPGMANVGVIAAGYLIQKLNLKPIGEIQAPGHFDIQAVEVRAGVIAMPHKRRNTIYSGFAGPAGPKITVIVGESQPTSGAYAFASSVIEQARTLGVDRVVTFASMASQMHPSQQSRAFGAATLPGMIDELRKLEVQPLGEGQISGLNGVLLGAAAENNISGTCLLGEIPFYAAQFANPKAARTVLDAFSLLAGFEIDLTEIDEHGQKMERVLLDLLERMQAQSGTARGENADFDGAMENFESPETESEEPPVHAKPPSPSKSAEHALDLSVRNRIESLFEAARKDSAQAVALKAELDRHGVFSRYENRFLDLFRRAH